MTVEEYEELEDAESERFCDLYNAIKRRPDGEIVILRAFEILETLADGFEILEALADPPVEEAQQTDWPRELAC